MVDEISEIDSYDAAIEYDLIQSSRRYCPTCGRQVPSHYFEDMDCIMCLVLGPPEVRNAQPVDLFREARRTAPYNEK